MLKKYIFLFIGIGIISIIGLGGSYTAPAFDVVNFSLCSGYTAPTLDSINFTLGEDDSCITDTCTYTSGDWNVDCSDNCVISSPVDLGDNDIFITGTGTFKTTSDISNYNLLHIEGTDASNICRVTCNGGCFMG